MDSFIDQEDFGFLRGTAYPGMIADASDFNFISRTVEETGLKFGDAAVGGTEDYQCRPFNVNNGLSLYFLGVVRRQFKQHSTTIGETENRDFDPPATVQIVDFGTIWVTASNTVKAGDRAAIDVVGNWLGGGDLNNSYFVSGATFITSGVANDLVQLKLTGGKTLTKFEPPLISKNENENEGNFEMLNTVGVNENE